VADVILVATYFLSFLSGSLLALAGYGWMAAGMSGALISFTGLALQCWINPYKLVRP
jgi:hypothetical protein